MSDLLKRATLLVMLLGIVLLPSGCGSSHNPHVMTDYDPNVDFSRYHTYAYQTGRIMNNGLPDTDNTLLDNRLHHAVDMALQSKGLQPVAGNDTPDLVVTYVAGAQRRQELEDLGPEIPAYGFGAGWYGRGYYGRAGWWGPGYDQFWVHDYTERTLILDLIDAHTHQLVWRAYAHGEVNRPPDQQRADRALAIVLKDYPPKPKH